MKCGWEAHELASFQPENLERLYALQVSQMITTELSISSDRSWRMAFGCLDLEDGSFTLHAGSPDRILKRSQLVPLVFLDGKIMKL